MAPTWGSVKPVTPARRTVAESSKWPALSVNAASAARWSTTPTSSTGRCPSRSASQPEMGAPTASPMAAAAAANPPTAIESVAIVDRVRVTSGTIARGNRPALVAIR